MCCETKCIFHAKRRCTAVSPTACGKSVVSPAIGILFFPVPGVFENFPSIFCHMPAGTATFNKVLYFFSNVIYFGIFISILLTFFGLFFSERVFLLMGSSNEVTSLGLEYTNIIFSGTVLFILVVSLNSLLHAEGDTKTYRNALILSFFLNIILNPILIFGFMFIPAFGVKGIGIATIISQIISFLIILFKVLQNQRIRDMSSEYLSIRLTYLKDIFFQSMPISLAICGYSIASAIIFTYVGMSGEAAAAGYGAATRIEQVVLLPVLGINTAIISIIAQNYGCLLYTSDAADE